MKNSLKLFVVALAAVGLLTTGCSSTRPAGEQMDDAAITTKIKAKLTVDPEVNPFNIDVDTMEGVVTLRGEVEKSAARSEAEKLARSTDGVVRVINKVRVVSAEYEDDEEGSDAWITAKIKSKITVDPELNPFNIDVDTEDGVVTLSGRVASESARNEAESLARGTKGVLSVVNELQVGDLREG